MVLILGVYVQVEASPRAYSPVSPFAVDGIEEAIALLLSEEMGHEELVGLRVLASAERPVSAGPSFFDSHEFLDSHSYLSLEARTLLAAYEEGGGLTGAEVALIKFVARDGLSVDELDGLKAVAGAIWTEQRFNDLAKSVIPARFNSMMVTVTVLNPESAPIEGALVSFESERTDRHDQYTDASGEVTFDLKYSESDQRVDDSALMPEAYSIRINADSYGEYELVDWPWIRDQWYHQRTLTAEPRQERYVHGSIARATIGTSTEATDSSTGPDSSMCNGWSSRADAPGADYQIVIGVTSDRGSVTSGITRLQSRAFQTYVKEVLPNEWFSSWPAESLRAGGVAAKQYAWYRGVTEGHTWRGSCYDAKDSIAYQVWVPGSTTSSTNAAVEFWWAYVWYRDEAWFITTYRSGSIGEACGANANGVHMYQWGSKACADDGSFAIDIARTYYRSTGQSVEWHK